MFLYIELLEQEWSNCIDFSFLNAYYVCVRQHVNTKIKGTMMRKTLISHKGLYLDGQHGHETNHKAVWTKFCDSMKENLG